MKNLIIATFFLFSCQIAKAQVELTVNPFLLLWGNIQVGVDLNLSKDWSIGGDALANEDGGLVYVTGKHFFNPKNGCDKFNIGAYLGAGGDSDDGALGLGFLIGYKVVSSKKIVFDMAIGLGRRFSDEDSFDLFPYGKFNFGYRFGLKKE